VSKHLLILTLSATALVAGCAAKPSEPIPPPGPLQTKSFARQWATSLQSGAENPVTAVHVSDQFVFAYRQDGSANVMDRATGRLLHIDYPRGGTTRIHPPVILGKDRIVYPTTTFLEVFDFDGHYIPHATKPSDEIDKPFSQEFRYAIRSDVVGVGKLVFFGADFPGSGRVVEVDMTRPYVPDIWTLVEPGAGVSAAPALSKDVVYVASEDGNVAAVSIESRAPLWSLPNGVFGTHGGVEGNLTQDETGLYVASTDTKLYYLAKASGKIKWQYFASVPLREGPVVTKDMVYQIVPGVGLAAIDKTPSAEELASSYDRKPAWIDYSAVQFLSEDGKYIYVRSNDNHIVALDKKTGQVRFASRRNDLAVFATNAKGDGVIYASTPGSRIMAIRPILEPGEVGELVMAPATPESLASAR